MSERSAKMPAALLMRTSILGESLADLVGKRPNGLLGRHVREQEFRRGSCCNLCYRGPGMCAALGIATDHQDARTHPGQFTRSYKANAAIGTRDENCLSMHCVTPSPQTY